MSAMKDQLQSDLTEAIRRQDELTMATLRMALSAITNAEVAGKEARELSDDEGVVVLTSEAKKRREAAESFDGAGASERADRERAELEVLQRYLPEQLSEEEIAAIVAAAIAAAAAEGKTGQAAMGAVMKIVTPQTRGRADGGQVAALVKTALA
ncbi:MAG: GatB/YqeY domain-containing protein [Candidatus Nanopelagicales bacterium]